MGGILHHTGEKPFTCRVSYSEIVQLPLQTVPKGVHGHNLKAWGTRSARSLWRMRIVVDTWCSRNKIQLAQQLRHEINVIRTRNQQHILPYFHKYSPSHRYCPSHKYSPMGDYLFPVSWGQICLKLFSRVLFCTVCNLSLSFTTSVMILFLIIFDTFPSFLAHRFKGDNASNPTNMTVSQILPHTKYVWNNTAPATNRAPVTNTTPPRKMSEQILPHGAIFVEIRYLLGTEVWVVRRAPIARYDLPKFDID